MTRDDIIARLESMPEAAQEPRIRAMARYLRTETATDPDSVLLQGIASMARQLEKLSDSLLAKGSSAPDTVREIVVALVDDRDYLGYMIEHAKGRITDEQMAELSAERLRLVEIDDVRLALKVIALTELVGERIDSELVSAVFKVDVLQARRVMWHR